MPTFSLIVRQSPFINDSHQRAIDFARALQRKKHTLLRVFFYQDGVLAASVNQTPGQGVEAISAQWQALSLDNAVPLQVCIANAIRRGIMNKEEQARYEQPAVTLLRGFELTGLGEIAQAVKESDRIIQF